ncbi:phage minor head protein [Streptomyces sp. NBC_00024]|uniref:phage minor head protein n=1 Tax=Streptomyces sp. NBC_00024 TaxID=2903612 RepID=UPI0032458E78
MDELEQLLEDAEEFVAQTVSEVLGEVADEFAGHLADATEIVAARFSVARIARMFTDRMPRIVRRLLRVSEQAAQHTADSVDTELPDGWDDLPGRYDDGRELPPAMSEYVDVTEHLLRAVGDRLAETARRELAAGVDEGEDIEQLRARLREAFAREGAQLGDMREERIARTEAGRAWNTATLGAAQAGTGPDKPVVKQWVTRRDARVREDHADANGQLRLIDEPFTVGGHEMSAPHDPTAPAGQVVNCRCVLAVHPEISSAAFESQEPPRVGFSDARRSGEVASRTAAADGSHLGGAMIALIPTEGDAAYLALDGGEEAGELHLTLFFLGDDGTVWTEEQRNELIGNLRALAASQLPGPVTGRAFGANHWNPDSDKPSWVWAVGDDRDSPADAPTLVDVQGTAVMALEDTHERPEIPVQHSPWVPHVCAAYSDDPAFLPQLEERLGLITFDRIRVAFAGDHTDIPLGPEEEPMEETATAVTAAQPPAAPPTRAWSTPDGAALAFENTETGDGRIFRSGALYWDGAGPWPLQYADEMLMGHEGAELAGAIESLGREGDRIPGTGVLYLSQRAGQDACLLLEQSAPLGVSVDLDSVDIEFVDKTLTEDEDGFLVLAASIPAMSVLRLDDGGWMLQAHKAREWTASGTTLTRNQQYAQVITAADGTVSADAVGQAFGASGILTAAAGDSDDPDTGVVLHSESAGDFLIRITKGRVRGATLVSMPAYDQARIVLDPLPEPEETAAAVAAADAAMLAAAGPGEDHHRVVTYVCASPIPVGAREVSNAVGIRMESARGHLTRAAKAGRLVRLAPGLYVGPSTIPETATVADVPTELGELEASAWTAMRDAGPMPAAWFREPTPEELPPGSGGVHYAGGRIYGWVAQAGEPHAGYPGKKLTIESLGEIDMTHFLRARFALDNGTTVKVGAFTMNVPHHRDGAECESAACQFDDTRTVAGVITCGLNERGLWFSGAAAPWLSEWDRHVFQACQPSYHMKQGPARKWQLRAVLSVPVPGHSSPLLATAVAERSNLALAASAAAVADLPDTAQEPDVVEGALTATAAAPLALPEQPPGLPAPAGLEETLAAVLADPGFLDGLTAALQRRESERAAQVRAEVEEMAAAVLAPAQPATAAMSGTITRGDM